MRLAAARMGCRETVLPECLADWIDQKLPGLAGVRTIRIRCCDRLPFEWLPGDRSWFQGITLWRRVYLRGHYYPIDPGDWEAVGLLLHELIHVEQFRRHPLLFPIRYLLDIVRHGYWDNPAEVEARHRADELIEEYFLRE